MTLTKRFAASVMGLLLGLFFVSNTYAQSEDHPWSASVSVLTHQYNGDFGNEVFQFQSDSDFGFQIGLTRYLSDRLNLRLDFVHATLDYNLDGSRDDPSQYPPSGPNRFETASNTVRAALLFDLLEKEDKYSLYALGGAGISFMNQSGEFAAGGSDESVTQIPVALGLGFNKSLFGAVSWNVELSYNFLLGSENDNIEGTPTTNGVNGQFDGTDADGFMVISTGLNFNLRGKKDMDGDGVADEDDMCPNVPGPKELNGCPDSDGDGVLDKDDNCPTVAGLESLAGCPDADGDGITDADDACPEVAGVKALNGCPDADGDGITDAEDACPNVAGVAALNGCPDADGDGITDADDACPNAAGPSETNGCPDADGDGIIDSEDDCPTETGIELFNGCPTFIYYLPFDVAEIPSDITDVLDNVASYLANNPNAKIKIQGHADNEGTDAYNINLSEKRAKRAFDYLITKGVKADQIAESKGYGESMPIDNNDTEVGRAKNRRVEIHIVD